MRKILLSLSLTLCGLWSGQAIGQIQIGKADMPAAGDRLLYTNVSDSIDVSQTGANYTWDFSKLNDVSQDSARYYTPLSINPSYAVQFAGSAAVRMANPIPMVNDYYGFFTSSATEYSMVGNAFTLPFLNIPFPSTFTDADRIFKLPLKYGNKDSGTFGGKVAMQGFTKSTFGRRKTVVDGWGSITTPYGTFDCLRIRSEVRQVDTFGGVPVDYSRTEYRWMAKGEKIPILEVVIPANGSIEPAVTRYKDKAKVIINPNGPMIDFSLDDTTVYLNDTVTFINSTQGFVLTWEWNFYPGSVAFVKNTTNGSKAPTVVFTKTGVYGVSVKGTGLNGSNTLWKQNYVRVIVAPKPVADFSASATTVTTDDEVYFLDMSQNGPRQWNWIFTPDNVEYRQGTYDGSPFPVVRFTQPGTYSVKMECANSGGLDNMVKFNYITVSQGVGIQNNSVPAPLEVFPNPGKDVFTVRTGEGMNLSNATWSLTDLQGRELNAQMEAVDTRSARIVASGLRAGFYLLKIQNGDKMYTGKVCVRE